MADIKTIEGKLSAEGLRVALVAGRFNGFIVDSLVGGARDALVRTGARPGDITLYHAPGAWEIPQVLARVVEAGGIDAAVALGCVIRGATPHFDYVAGAVARGVENIAASSKLPVAFGVLTTDTIEQAIERAGTKAGNKGFEAAMAAIEMAQLFRTIGS